MAEGLRVLYVDDEPELLEMAKIFLEMHGEFQVGISTSATESIKIPLARSYDAIVSDYEMPEMNGIAFLKHVREQFGDIPFILFTGRGREEVVIDAINNGADFYLQKGGSAQAQFAELAHKIRQAVLKRRAQAELREAYDRITASEEELARSELQLQESEGKFRDFADHLPQMVFETDMDLRITYVNKYTITEYGFPAEARGSGMSVLTFIHPSQHATFMESVHHLRYGIPFEPKEYKVFNKNRQPFPVIVYSSPIFRNKRMVGFRGVVVDISDRKRAETALRESEEKHRTFAEMLPQTVFELDRSLTLTFVNKQAIVEFGYTPEEVASGFSALTIIDPSHHDRLRQNIANLMRGEPSPHEEYTLIRKNGTTFPGLIYADLMYRNGQLAGFRGIIIDISKQKQSEQALRESEQKYRTLVEVIQDIVYSLDSRGTIIYISPHVRDQTGYSPDELVGKNFAEFVHPDDAGVLSSHIRSRRPIGSPRPQDQFRVRRRDSTYRWYEDKSIPILNAKNEQVTIGTIRDINERKQAEDVLRESEEKHRTFAEMLPQIVFEVDSNFRLIFVNNQGYAQLGFSPEEIAKGVADPLSVIDPSQHARLKKNVEKIARGEPVTHEEYTYIRKDGSTFPALLYADPVYKNGTLAGFRGIVLDISEQKQAESALRESEEKYRLLVENASDIVFSLDRAGNFTYISPQWSEILGHEIRGLIGTPASALIHPDDLVENIRAFRTVIGKGTWINGLEYRVRHRDGSWRWHSQSAAPVRNASGEIVSYMGICHDITDRKRAEEALRESEAHYRLLADHVKDVIWTADLEMNLTYVSPSIKELRGLSPQEAMTEPLQDAMTEDSLAILRKHRQTVIDALTSGSPVPDPRPMELEFRKKDGSTVWTEVIITPTLASDGTPTGVVGITRDISQRRASDKALRESEKMFSTIFRNSQIALTLLSVKDNRFFDVNEAFVRNSGYSREDVIGRTPWEVGLLVNQDMAERIAAVLKKDRHIEATEVRFRTKSGMIQTCLYAANLIRMKGELYLLSSVTDISERKNAEEALRQANRKLNILSGITRHDINNQLHALVNYVELLRQSVPDSVHDANFSRINDTIEQITSLIQFTREYEMIGVHEPVWQDVRKLVAAAGKAALPQSIHLEKGLPGNLEIFADPLISKVFFNMLDNARRHGGTIRQVRFTSEMNNGDCIIVCSDDGVGVPPADKERIFAPGVGKNTGFGLAISREILDITGITIRETGEEGKGARFEIAVPSGKHRTSAKE